jgi:hypothetical protein
MAVLTNLQRRILSLLEEAGEEEFCTLTNTVAKAEGRAAEIEVMSKTLSELMNAGLIELARARDAASLRWVAVSTTEAQAFFEDLGKYVEWSMRDRLWTWHSKMPTAEVLLTDSSVENQPKRCPNARRLRFASGGCSRALAGIRHNRYGRVATCH